VTSTRAEITEGTADAGTKRRFDHALHHILTNGALPNAVSGMVVDGRVLVLDGNHRIAALTAAQIITDAMLAAKGWKKPPATPTIWMGKHKDGEVPLT
jgi:hypothetical protein